MIELTNWLLELLFPEFAKAATAITVLLSILYVISVMRDWMKVDE